MIIDIAIRLVGELAGESPGESAGEFPGRSGGLRAKGAGMV
jgi:hypothetical protein